MMQTSSNFSLFNVGKRNPSQAAEDTLQSRATTYSAKKSMKSLQKVEQSSFIRDRPQKVRDGRVAERASYILQTIHTICLETCIVKY